MDKNKPQVHPPDLSELYITEIDGGINGGNAARFTPLGYNIRVIISPMIILALVRWGIRNGYITLDDNLYCKVNARKEKVNKNGK